ncbi:Uncharacterized membrane protein [Myxococcus fulvus]|uniref:Uncharacterized membrane protein n=1 Tax=Myxococcus fulvus TaxID=33 RepID=A0A511T134_MYXFU|nr:DUF1990 family protein [Myxococcus fulvus]GEN07870.1 hypothetical protein MFU01_29070 [Myxococcus fulvus]SES77029.1 Uncharacterized membrane protein [Myxococcus fulvus]
MIEWRWLSGWTDEELAPRLAAARSLSRNFEAASGEMTLEGGWNQVHSVSSLGREPPGPPVADGLFARAKGGLETFDFSDPRIVRWHFNADSPLHGRTVLLELKSLAQRLRFLCAVRVGDTREEHGETCSVYGFSFETLGRHIEEGREWFLLRKSHETGEVRFHIEAAWRPGKFPNLWSRVGFTLVGRRYQRAWHRLTHARLRALTLHHPELAGRPAEQGKVDHSGHELEGLGPVRFFAQRAPGRLKSQLEEEVEAVQRGHWLTPIGLGVMAGMRSMSAPALVSHRLAESPEPRTDPLSVALSKPWVPRVLEVLTLGELVGDKLPTTPARVKLVPMTGRIFMGAVAAATSVSGQTRKRRVLAAALGGLAAAASTWTFYSLRKMATTRFRVPSMAAAFAEDALVAAIASRLMPLVSNRPAEA